MFNNLTKKISVIIKKIYDQGRLTKKNIKYSLRELRKSLLEADVALLVIKKFTKNIKKKVIGKKINQHLTPGQEFIKIVKKELIKILGKKNKKIKLNKNKLTKILIIGLQGSGKTTNLIKLGKLFKKKNKKKILTVSTDVNRFSAIKQLKLLSEKEKLDVFLSKKNDKPINIAKKSIKKAKKNFYDILLIDTSGRLHNNKKMMKELKNMYKKIKPNETLFVIDSMIGQDSINIIKKYNNLLPITGIILTKMDSNARCGIALSCKYLTKIPIKFISNGEKINSIKKFCPIKITKKILGLNNIFSLIKKIKKKIKIKKKKKKKIIKKKISFNLNDCLKYLKKIKKSNIINKIINKISIKKKKKNKTLKELETIIYSMTNKERKNPKIIKNSRKKRIAKGSGISVQKINILLRNFLNIKKTIIKIKKNGINKIFNSLKNFIPNFF
ncbi:signal recognition particle receptor subunit alpha [Buchnera aphidicola]|uniref:signal recognition particle receptor subunit alpha n=1 Tax=Buchnera aphidicola TaxID=9 RepID=UPI0031B7ECB6